MRCDAEATHQDGTGEWLDCQNRAEVFICYVTPKTAYDSNGNRVKRSGAGKVTLWKWCHECWDTGSYSMANGGDRQITEEKFKELRCIARVMES